MKLLFDQGVPRGAVRLCNDAGMDAIHVSDLGMHEADDPVILEYARTEGRTVITFDADFHTLLALSGMSAPSVIRIRVEGLKLQACFDLIRQIIADFGAELTAGAVISADGFTTRLRLLPLLRVYQEP